MLCSQTSCGTVSMVHNHHFLCWIIWATIESPPQKFLEHFCLLWVSFCSDGVLFCPEYHTQPLFFTQQSHTPFWDIYMHKIFPTPPQYTPFPGLNLKMGKMNCSVGNLDPNLAKWLKSGQNVSKSEQKKLFIWAIMNSACSARSQPVEFPKPYQEPFCFRELPASSNPKSSVSLQIPKWPFSSLWRGTGTTVKEYKLPSSCFF